jgi:hypothetical protein
MPTATHRVAEGQLTEASRVLPEASGATSDSVDHVQAPRTRVPVVATPSAVASSVECDALSSPTATHVVLDGQLTERRPPNPVAPGGTIAALDHSHRVPFHLADATIPFWDTLSPTATHIVAVGQLTPMSRSIPVLPAASTLGALHRQDRPTLSALVTIA